MSVPDAANYLSTVFDEKVSEADIFRITLDGKLKLSVNFVNGANAIRGKIINREEVKWKKGLEFIKSLKPKILIQSVQPPLCDQALITKKWIL